MVNPRWRRHTTLEEMEAQIILAALYYNKWNRTNAAKELGIAIRTMTNKLQAYRMKGHVIPERDRFKCGRKLSQTDSSSR